MMERIQDMECLRLSGENGEISWGGDQNWYPFLWQRRAGCGPTCAATLLFYHRQRQRSRQGMPVICSRQPLLTMMEEVWRFVTPARGGVNTLCYFSEGLRRYRDQVQLCFQIRTLTLAQLTADRPAWETVADFVQTALRHDAPVAFLCLDRGQEKRLDDWHWVVITALDPQSGDIEFLDESVVKQASLRLWLSTTASRGGLAWLDFADESMLNNPDKQDYNY